MKVSLTREVLAELLVGIPEIVHVYTCKYQIDPMTTPRMKKILVIDDEVDFGLLVKNFFTARNFKVSVAHNIRQGMKYLETERPDYLFLDNDLPDGAGWTKTQFIIENYPNTQIHLISALGAPRRFTSSFRMHEKPIALEELARMLD